MGTIHLAEQTEPVRRQIVLEVIELGMDSKAVVSGSTGSQRKPFSVAVGRIDWRLPSEREEIGARSRVCGRS
jgi:hypothetical protein